ncbi:hypothetical protein mvi_05420 [Methylobacterium indicum]|uniref:Uncharacterized protein n=1 Tax=Methylobacterium indicum TaxID=1775910 RepID=A0A8H9C422_9HYPH|nr:hypothetical protein mvi_05420 [Methylobacterium indicum]
MSWLYDVSWWSGMSRRSDRVGETIASRSLMRARHAPDLRENDGGTGGGEAVSRKAPPAEGGSIVSITIVHDI